MDWEKKTAKRDALSGAAADTFNEMLTPAQTLLRTLQVRYLKINGVIMEPSSASELLSAP